MGALLHYIETKIIDMALKNTKMAIRKIKEREKIKTQKFETVYLL